MWVSAARGLYDGGRDGRAIDFDTRSVGKGMGWRLGGVSLMRSSLQAQVPAV